MTFNLDNVVPILRARGLKVVETEGWSTRGYAGQDLQACRGVLWHHTATASARNPAAGNMPTLNVLINGRADLPGPLCNFGLGRDGTVYVVATGVANHAGTGSAPNIPTNMGNHYMVGIEMESSGTAPWDWTPAMLDAAPKLGAALELAYMMGLPPELRLQMGHMEYSDAGKPDPSGWPGGMNGLRASINARIAEWTAAPKPPAPKPPVKPAPAPGRKTYPDSQAHWTVEKGDTLSKIARFYYSKDDAATIKRITDHMGMKPTDTIKPGDKIWVPGPIGWVVEPGDDVQGIADRYGFDANAIARLNGLAGPRTFPPVGSIVWIQK